MILETTQIANKSAKRHIELNLGRWTQREVDDWTQVLGETGLFIAWSLDVIESFVAWQPKIK